MKPPNFFCNNFIILLILNLFLQKELSMDTAHQLYYTKVLDPTFCDLEVLSSLSNKAMESVKKEHMTTFHKKLHVCDPSLGP
jgi:hypothetical protein